MRPKSELVLMSICVGSFIEFGTICDRFGAQVDAVLDLLDVDCQFGENLGVLKSVEFEVQQRQMPCLVFFKYKVSTATIVEVSNRVFTLFFQYKLTFVKMIARIDL